MNKQLVNTLLIFAVVLVVTGAGYYQTEVSQPAELERIDEAKKLARLQQAELEQLFVEEAASEEQAEETMRKWRARYKYIPAQLETPDIVQYLEGLSKTGFEQFKVQLGSRGATRDFSYYVFDVSGTAYYSDLYSFIWHIENNREFYQIDDLDVSYKAVFKKNEETGLQKRLDMVGFSMKLKVFFAGAEGLSAPIDELMEVPDLLLPAKYPAHNSFYPIVRPQLPPNDELLVDVEKDALISIVGNQAIFENELGQHVLRVGDPIYLGTITEIDPRAALVRARLNKGGVEDIVEIKIEADPLQNFGREPGTRLVPNENGQ